MSKETSASIKKAMNEARAAIILNKEDASEADKLDAIAVIRQRADQDTMALLGGLPSDSPESVLKASRRNVQHVLRATNDNDEASGDERRYATYR